MLLIKPFTEEQKKAYRELGDYGWKIMLELTEELGFDFTRPHLKRYVKLVGDKPVFSYAQVDNDIFGTLEWRDRNIYGYYDNGREIDKVFLDTIKYPVAHFVDKDKIRKHFSSFINAYVNETTISKSYNRYKENKSAVYAECQTIVMKRNKDTCIMVGDIDVHHDYNPTTTDSFEIAEIQKLKDKADYTFQCIREEFKHILFYEKSVKNGGYHFYLSFDSVVDDKDIKNYIKYFNAKYSVDNLELMYSTTGVRLPMSATYEAFTSDDKPINTPQELYGCFHIQKEDGIFNFYSTFKEKADSTIVELNTYRQPAKPVSIFESTKVNQNEKKKFRPKDISSDFPMFRDNRIKTHFSLANYCIANSLDYNSFYSASLSNNRGSKDLTNNPIETCKTVWESAVVGFDASKWGKGKGSIEYNSEYGFISNTHLLDVSMKKYVNRIANGLIEKLLLEKKESTVRYNNIKDSKWFNKQSEAIKLLLPEIIGYIIYNKEHRIKSIRDDAVLKDETRYKMKKGFSFSRIYLSKFKEHYNLTIDINVVFSFIMKNSNLFKQIYINEKGWIYIGFLLCKQFELKERTMVKYDTIKNQIIFNLKNAIHSLQYKYKSLIRIINVFKRRIEYKRFISYYIKSLKDISCKSPPNYSLLPC